MGRQLLQGIAENELTQISAAVDRAGTPAIGVDAQVLCADVPAGVTVVDSVQQVSSSFDTIIDFSAPAASIQLLNDLKGSGASVVIGTTGFDEAQLKLIDEAAKAMPIVFAANYSIGVNLTLSLLEKAASALGDDYDVEVIEAHHHHKVDAPSGTALKMGEVLADALGRNLKDCAVYAREGITGARNPKEIGFATIRAGDIVGEHTVLFAGNGERIEITHKANDRATFARGAVRAALWLSDQPAGLYDMNHVLGLKPVGANS